MLTKVMKVEIPTGLEARPIAMLVQVVSRYESKVYLENRQKKVNAKSIMGMMNLDLSIGDEVTVTVDGPDEMEALISIEKYLCEGEA